MNEQRDLELILNSHFPIITIETHEEPRAIDLLNKVVAVNGKTFYTWTATTGLIAGNFSTAGNAFSIEGLTLKEHEDSREEPTKEPAKMLATIQSEMQNAVIVLIDFHPYLEDHVTVRNLKEIAHNQENNHNTLVLLSHAIEVPDELKKLSASFELSMPDKEKMKKLLINEAKIWNTRNKGQQIRTNRDTVDAFVRNLIGLTESDAKRLIKNAIYDDGAITEDDLTEVMAAKYELIGGEDVLAFEYDTAKFTDVGGFSNMKKWLKVRKPHFLDQETKSRLDSPKGILLLGVQGSGKSLAAKAVAGAMGVPLLRLDFGALYNKFFGETERNIRDSLKIAEVMSPCVLWMDEIEKGISTGDYDSGTSNRVLATLLTWMAENKARVFLVATANNIQSLPPELIRKGRFDELFFVDLPTHDIRTEIFSIHLSKRQVKTQGIDLELLAQASEGFSGAEIEQSVVAALYTSHADKRDPDTEDILEEIKQTQPLSIIMDEKISSLRQWASKRTVSAN